jgi:molybdenum ABC transporter molybdate-binding protein
MFALIAANATDPFNDLIEEFEKVNPDVNVEATFAGTQIIRTQLEQGAKADLFLSADLEHIEAVKQQGLIDAFFPVSNNHVVIVVPKDDRVGIRSLEDLATKKVKLVIGTDTVPIGKYTRQVFENAKVQYGTDFPEKVMSNVVSLETNVKQVLQKVAMGEAEAGIVYPTDVTPEFLKKVEIIEIPKEYNVVATNYISVPNEAPNKELSKEFMQMMLSEKGQEIFMKYNYDPLK